MAWSAPLDAAASWNVTDRQQVSDATYRLLENGDADATGTSFVTTMFTVSQFLDALAQRQQRFLKETGAIVTRVTEVTTAQVPRYALPSDLVAVRRVTWQKVDDSIYALYPADTYQMDTGMPDWQYDFSDPVVYSLSALPTLEMEIRQAPNDVGTLALNYVALAPALDGSGIKLAVPDELAPTLLYGALADLLSSDGEGKDLLRAAYCERRYQLGLDMAKLLMEGL